MSKQSKVWFITGASKGIGQLLAQQVLKRGDRVAVTSRTLDSLEAAFGAQSAQMLPLQVDLTSDASMQQGIARTIETFGRIDVVVNNAGYGQQGTVEALLDSELRQNFEVNFFAPVAVLRHALPHLRRQKAGRIINISSIVGFNGGYAGWGSYVSSKFALSGLTETLAAELAELGITATVIYPGPARTDFLSSGSLAIAKNKIDEYKAAQESLDLHLGTYDGHQAGDPEKLATLITRVADAQEPPVHLFAGHIANDLAGQKMQGVSEQMAAWKEVAVATDFED